MNYESKKIAIPDHVLVQEFDGEMVLLNINNESYYGLDEGGTIFWEVLTNSPSIEAGIEELLDEFEVEAEVLIVDIQKFLEKMSKNGLIQINDQ